MKISFNRCWFIGLTLGISVCYFPVDAQVSEKGWPESFMIDEKSALIIPALTLDSLLIDRLKDEDRKFKIDNRYGIVSSAETNIRSKGIKTELKDKGTIWRYQIDSKNARSLGLFFTKYHLPERAKLFIYDRSGKLLRGAFTSKNNNPKQILPLAEFPSKDLIIEYFEPFDAEFEGELVLGAVSQAYLLLPQLDSSRISINCEEGADWQVIKHSVCLMTYHDFQNSYFCTGSLINNVNEDEIPYFLTANHCIDSEVEAGTLVTYFNYENSSCSAEDASFSQTLAGATYKAGSQYSDFSLLLLNEYPPDEYNPFFAGWDVSGANPRSSACIHHPDGAPKCIATSNNTVFSYPEKIQWFSEDLRLLSTTMPDTHWHSLFNKGLPEAGSSGAPLFDQNKRIVGQLHGGVNAVLLFGKLSLSWDYYDSPDAQLATWLDPIRTTKTLDGIWKMPPRTNFRSALQEVCVNSPVQFNDQSVHKPSEWLWQIEPRSYEFTNGTDSTSQNPQVLFLKDGFYSVKLRSSNKYGSDELVKKQYIIARSKLDVRFLKARRDSVVCGCDLKSFQLVASGAVNYRFEIEQNELIDTTTRSNSVFLTLNPQTNINHSFDTWVKVTGTNGNCTETDSIFLHIVIQPNDQILNAANLYLGKNTGYSNKCATPQINEPFPPSSGCLEEMSWCPDLSLGKSLVNNSVWFKFVAPMNGKVTINTSGFDDQIAVYDADTPNALLSNDRRQYKLMAANDNKSSKDKTANLENIELEPGKQYWLQVDGHHAAYGDLTIDLISNSLEAIVFPNPTNGKIQVNIFDPEAGVAEVTVSDVTGKKLMTTFFEIGINTTRFNLDLGEYPKGVYFLQVNLNGRKVSRKIIRL